MKKILLMISAMMLVLMIGACAPDKDSSNTQGSKESKEPQDSPSAQEPNDDAYHLPILDGWTEILLEKKKIGNDTIDLWNAEFSFEGDMNIQLEQYISALKDMGFEVEVELDEEFVKEVKFSKEEKGKKHDGVSTLRNNEVQSKSQIQP